MDKYGAAQKYLKRLQQAKEQLRQKLAGLPYEEKIARLRQLQKLAEQLRPIREQLRRQLEAERKVASGFIPDDRFKRPSPIKGDATDEGLPHRNNSSP